LPFFVMRNTWIFLCGLELIGYFAVAWPREANPNSESVARALSKEDNAAQQRAAIERQQSNADSNDRLIHYCRCQLPPRMWGNSGYIMCYTTGIVVHNDASR
jgi:hypothetical protein